MEINYSYDGSFMGFLCCVFESYAAKEIPRSIFSKGEKQQSLFDCKEIETNDRRANRVLHSLAPKMGQEAYDMVLRAFLTCLPEREKHMLLFIRSGLPMVRRS